MQRGEAANIVKARNLHGTLWRKSDADGSTDPASIASGALTDFRSGFLRVELRLPTGRAAHQAVKAAKQYAAQGLRVVVGMDLEKFFDRVNHNHLMAKLAKKIGDGRGLAGISQILTDRLKLTVNEAKNAVARPKN
mgnify:CR=1 FL=1